jgi:hypothetical protein
MDSGASFHVCHSRKVKHNYKHYKGNVKLEYGKPLDITRVGHVSLKTTLGTKWILKYVKLSPYLKWWGI